LHELFLLIVFNFSSVLLWQFEIQVKVNHHHRMRLMCMKTT